MNSPLELASFINFFEVEPTRTHEAGWFYGAHFEVKIGADSVLATVAPDEAEFFIEWRQGERTLLKLKLVMVTEWIFQTLSGREQLLLKTATEREGICVITLKPEVAINLELQW
jgi:hypothetical protein